MQYKLLEVAHEVERFWTVVKTSLKHRERRRAVELWLAFLGAPSDSLQGAVRWIDANELHVAAFLEYLRDQPGNPDAYGQPAGLADGTIATRLGALRAISERLRNAGLLKQNPFKLVKMPNAYANQKNPSQRIPDEHVREILNGFGSRWRERRNHAICCLLLGGALRTVEVRKLRIADVRTRGDAVYLVLKDTKSGVDQFQTIAPMVAQAVSAFAAGEKTRRDDSQYLFTRNRLKGGILTESTIPQMLRRTCEKLGLPHYSPHDFRATTATILFEQGERREDVQEFMRHKSEATTTIYDKRQKSIQNPTAGKIKI